MDQRDRVASLLLHCGTKEGILPPTALFNEGWMLRLVLDWAANHRNAISVLRFLDGSRWYSEAWLPSRFKPRRRGDPGGEGYTHADGVIGHFDVQSGGDIQLLADARQLTVIEAKMASGLSAGTSRAPQFDQASRNVACMANLLTKSGLALSQFDEFSFVVLAPKRRIETGVFKSVQKELIKTAVKKRAADFDSEAVLWCGECFDPVSDRCSIAVESWENILAAIDAVYPEHVGSLSDFYQKCLHYNPIRP